MMRQKMGDTGEYALAAIGAIIIAGAIYLGMLLLNQGDASDTSAVVAGAIRITMAEREKTAEPLQREKLKEDKPPERLPKVFTSRSKVRRNKPELQLSAPSFTADTLPGLAGDITLPRMELGPIGFNMDEVDQRPQTLRAVSPQYPYGAKRSRTEGKVVIRMLVTSQGVPTQLSIKESTPPGVFDQTALNAAKRWTFRPGRYKGKPVDTWVLLPFNFELTQ